MLERSMTIMKHLSSNTCNKIIGCLKEGMNHPDDISKKLGVVRQTVDWHLVRLGSLGIVERVPVSSLSGRPKIVYKLSADGEKLINTISDTVQAHYLKIRSVYEHEIKKLDRQLAKGTISEAVYIQKVAQIEKDLAVLDNNNGK